MTKLIHAHFLTVAGAMTSAFSVIEKNQYEYKSIVFDCDGVILNSNKIKTRAFRLA